MRMYDLIAKKKIGGALNKEEIDFMIKEYMSGEVKDYQMSAMLMAICFQGMNEEETALLTMAMRDSGDTLDLSGIEGIKVDKHSTGGVGDKISLVLTPMVAALGIPVAKMSGRGLGFTGGTVDKLECFPGFHTDMPEEEFIKNVNEIKMAIAGQTKNLAPADKKIYALRDVTATVDQLSLIAASIMSKKLAAGSDKIVLDVKTGSGAFMKEEKDAFALAEEMVKIGKNAGKETIAVVTDMDQPLGTAVGNAIEVKEAILSLCGAGPKDLMEVVYALGEAMVVLGGKAASKEEAHKQLEQTIEKGTALDKLAQFVEAQGGDKKYVYQPGLLATATHMIEVKSGEEGYVSGIHAEEIGRAALSLGGGRVTKESVIDPAVGVMLFKKKGDFVQKGETLSVLHANDLEKAKEAYAIVIRAYQLQQEAPKQTEMIKGVVK